MEINCQTLWGIGGDALISLFRQSPRFYAELSNAGTLSLSGEQAADLNFAIIKDGPEATRCLQKFFRSSVEKDCPCMFLLEHGGSKESATIAKEIGLTFAANVPLMVCQRPQSHVSNQDLTIRRVTNSHDLRSSQTIIAKTFSISQIAVENVFCQKFAEQQDVDVFIAYDGGASVCTVQATHHGSVVGIWCMATDPEHQRRGFGRATLEYALRDLMARGAKCFYLLATEAGRHLYESVGFEQVDNGAIWLNGTSSQVG
jgi:ribosomal protein S18 acetylase RimI-like enzyme